MNVPLSTYWLPPDEELVLVVLEPVLDPPLLAFPSACHEGEWVSESSGRLTNDDGGSLRLSPAFERGYRVSTFEVSPYQCCWLGRNGTLSMSPKDNEVS
jgi:hypothetical protein